MQYAIINGRIHELLAGITFYSIYSHLNWVMWQWCTAIESCLPPGWPPRALQIWSENERGVLQRVDGLKDLTEMLQLHSSVPSIWVGMEAAEEVRASWMIIAGAEHRRNTETHVETCVQTCTNSCRFILPHKAPQHACWCTPHWANYLN